MLGFVVVSLVLFLVAQWLQTLSPEWNVFAGPLRETGTLLLTVGGVQFLLRTKLWKDAIESIGERLQVRDATVYSGLIDYWKFDAVPWEQLFGEAEEVTIVAISLRSLLVERTALVRAFLAREGTTLKLVLADFRAGALMARFDAEFNETPGTRAQKLKEALGELIKVLDGNVPDKVEILLSPSRVPYSLYRFDERILFVPYIAEPIRDASRIPALFFGEGSMKSSSLEPDLKHLLKLPKVSFEDLKRLV